MTDRGPLCRICGRCHWGAMCPDVRPYAGSKPLVETTKIGSIGEADESNHD